MHNEKMARALVKLLHEAYVQAGKEFENASPFKLRGEAYTRGLASASATAGEGGMFTRQAEDAVEGTVRNYVRQRTTDGWTREEIGDGLADWVREIVAAAQ